MIIRETRFQGLKSQDPGQGGLAYGLDASERAVSVSEDEKVALGGQMWWSKRLPSRPGI